MERNRVMSNSDWQAWYRNAEEHLTFAKRSLNSGMPEVAYERAIYSGECALKSVLVKNGLFTADDYTHNQEIILRKIARNNLLNESILSKLRGIITDIDGIYGLSRVDLSVGMSHQDCIHVAQTRYPTDDYTSYDMLKSGNAEEKIILAEKLLEILDGNF